MSTALTVILMIPFVVFIVGVLAYLLGDGPDA